MWTLKWKRCVAKFFVRFNLTETTIASVVRVTCDFSVKECLQNVPPECMLDLSGQLSGTSAGFRKQQILLLFRWALEYATWCHRGFVSTSSFQGLLHCQHSGLNITNMQTVSHYAVMMIRSQVVNDSLMKVSGKLTGTNKTWYCIIVILKVNLWFLTLCFHFSCPKILYINEIFLST